MKLGFLGRMRKVPGTLRLTPYGLPSPAFATQDEAPCGHAMMLGRHRVKAPNSRQPDLGTWSSFYVNTLRFHETCILFMLVGGAIAGLRAFRLRRTRRVTMSPDSPPAPATLMQSHRRAGWTAIVSCYLAVLSAGVVLLGMYSRL